MVRLWSKVMSGSRGLSYVVALSILCALAAPTSAQQVTVVGVDAGDMPSLLAEQTTRGALLGASRSGLHLEDYTHVNVLDTMQLLGCSEVDDRCLQEFASTLSSRIVVVGKLRHASTAILDLRIYDAALARTTVESAIELPPDGVEEYVAFHVAAFLQGRVVVQVETPVGRGEALVDGVSIGVTPAATDRLGPGAHQVVVAFDDGREGTIDVTLERVGRYVLTVAPTGRARGSMSTDARNVRPLRVVGWTCVVGAVGAGALAVVSGQQVRDAEQAFAATPFQRQAREEAARGDRAALRTNLSIGVGAALAVGGAAALLADRAQHRGVPTAAVAPTRGGAHAVLRWDL